MKALLLCAGLGSRLHPYTRNRSKVALPFLNIPIMAYPLKILESAKVSHLLVNTHHQAKQVKKTIESLKLNIPHISFFHEPALLEGLGTLKENLNFFKGEEDIIYLNGDSVFLCDDFFSQICLQHKKKKALMTFLCSPFKKGASYLWADSEGRVVPKGNNSHQAYFFAGFVLINQECFSLFNKSDNHLFKDFVNRHSHRCFIYMQKDLKFFEIGSLSGYMQALQTCAKYLENPLSKEAKLLNQILSRYLSSEFMQSSNHFHLDYLRRQFFSQAKFFK
ncbi:MAG: sugar phosphate nucleotidyltransferase [Bdellovibrionales bacterium]|nr:sugar phosphate nucleotidyltransferase [Bdellovibrionales bacterium]